MITNLKALVIILVLASITFHLAKPICLKFMSLTDFARRRNVWMVLTITAFLSPSFWLYVLVAFPVMYWAARKDSNPLALYVLLLHVIPAYSMEIPAVLVNRFFDLDNYRILALAILLPLALHFLNTKNNSDYVKYKVVDRYVWAYFFLQIILFIPYEDITNTFRRALLLIIDQIILFYVVSRACGDRKSMKEVVVMFTLACAIFVPIAVFESQKLWLLYTGLSSEWGMENRGAYLFRDGNLRAQVSVGHSLALGYILTIAFGFWLYISNYVPKYSQRILGGIGIWLGLIAALSRAPWITALLTFSVYTVLQKNGYSKLIKSIIIIFPFAFLVSISPIGPAIINKLPFIGAVDNYNVDYRQRLAETSWNLMQNNPFFGDPFFVDHMENMRQGDGIVDLVNVYASVTLASGIVGLFLFVGPLIVGIITTWRASRESLKDDSDLSMLGSSILACLLGTAFFMATGSFDGVVPKAYYFLTGLAAAYGQLKKNPAE